MVNWLTWTGKRLYEIIEDKNPRPESVSYENAVYQQVQVIASTTIGGLLLESLNHHVKVWIVPLDPLDRSQCTCGAYAFPGKPNEGGGVRVYYNPTDFNPSAKRWRGADDILFHELVHAYRNGRVGYDVVNSAQYMNDYENAEEFLALHLQNVYLACRGSQRFYRTYKRLESVSKDTAYQYFVGDAEVLTPADSFNPWRDQRVLERLYISNQSLGISRLPPF